MSDYYLELMFPELYSLLWGVWCVLICFGFLARKEEKKCFMFCRQVLSLKSLWKPVLTSTPVYFEYPPTKHMPSFVKAFKRCSSN